MPLWFLHIYLNFTTCAHNRTSASFVLRCRLYTGIHAKPKSKFKTGAISESTTALNVDQSNTSVLNAEVKTAPSGATLPLQSPLDKNSP